MKGERLTLWAETDDEMIERAKTPRAEVVRLLRKMSDIEECMAATTETLKRHRSRLKRVKEEIDRIEQEVGVSA